MPDMNLAELQRKLLAAARANPPGGAVPYAFEKRIMAHLRSFARVEDAMLLWSRALWRAAGACVAVSVLLGVWSYQFSGESNPDGSFSQDLEHTLLAAVDEADETW